MKDQVAGESIHWAPKVPQHKIRRLYESDAEGLIDTDLIDEVGWALWERCESILTVTTAHYGRVRCPTCSTVIERQDPWCENEIFVCTNCGWQSSWAAYHQSYRGKQLFGANATRLFEDFHRDFPQLQAAREKMVAIDQLIHGFHVSIKDIGRPAAANLIQGSLEEVIHFLDGLASGDSQVAWRRTLAGIEWAQHFIKKGGNSGSNE